jgi:hypothetical protein
MTIDEQFDQGPAGAQPAPQARPAILDRCRAARIDNVTDFAECLVETTATCAHRLAFNAFRYCVHPEREAIIARTLAAGPTPSG